VRHGILEPAIRSLPVSRATRLGELGRKARRFLDGAVGDPAQRHDALMRFAPAAEVDALLGGADGGAQELELIRAIHADYEARGGADPLNRVLFTDFRLALPSDMLLKVDTASMLNSLEVRVPFLDHRIVELAMALPGRWKMDGAARKRILKDAVGDLLPASVKSRPKAGFDVPVGEWLKGPLREMFWDTVGGGGDLPLDARRLETWYDEHARGRQDRTKILWAVFALRWWERRGARPAERPATEMAGAAS
jgi:asparagine synthase (glutamine-hydrolysing)